MRITINGQPYEVYEYDDDTTILERYSLSQEDALPSFFRIENKDFVIKSGVALQVSDVRSVIGLTSGPDLANPTTVESILISYPKLKKRDIGILWIILNYQINDSSVKGPIDITFLRSLDRIAFLTPAKAAMSVSEFIKRINKEREQITSRTKREKKIYGVLDKYPLPITGPFILEEITNQIVLNLPNGENLLDIFDALEASRNVPFIVLARKKKIYYKVFRHIIPPLNWVEFVPPHEGIFFKILNMPTSKLSARLMLENLYSDGVWTADRRVEFNFKVRMGISEEDLTKRLFDSLGDRLDYEVAMTRQTSIKGIFTITNVNFDRAIFADMVATNEYFKYFLFFNEKGGTVLSKQRVHVYYAPDEQGIISKSLALIITPQTIDGDTTITIRVSHAINSQQANSARLITSKLFSLYAQEYQGVVDIYSQLVDDFNRATVKQKKEKKGDKKTGPRAAALRKVNPEMFGSRYPDQCQKERQPYVLENAQDALAKAEELGDPHKVMLFEGSWYACEPREPYLDPLGNKDKDDKHVYPGLKENKPKTKDTERDKEYREKYPDLACCFVTDQYEKDASRFRKYREGLEKGTKSETPEKESGAGYVKGINKLLPPGRFGDLPFNWEKVLHYLKIDKVTRGKQTFYPILRQGVTAAPDSIIHCLERAFNPRYVSLTTTEKKNTVVGVRRAIANSNLNISRQELYDYTESDIREMLLDENEYLAPEAFISLLQKHYECNIFIYVLDDAHPNGDIVIPRNSQAYLSRDINEMKKSVLILEYKSGTDEYPYQCEIFCQLDVKMGKIRGTTFVFENSPIVQMAVKLFYDANEVFVVSTDGYEPYRPVPELE